MAKNARTFNNHGYAPEKSLLGTENLHSGGRVLGKVGEAARVRDEAGSDLTRVRVR